MRRIGRGKRGILGRLGERGVVVHGKGADSVAGYPFISDVKIQTCLEQEWSEVTLVQGRGSNMEVTGERSLGEILWENKRSINPPHDPQLSRLNNHPLKPHAPSVPFKPVILWHS